MSALARTAAVVLLCWTVTAQPTRTVDGDTFVALTLAYPKIVMTERVRVLGVDTPEMRAPTLVQAQAAKAFTEAWLAKGAVTLEIGCTGQAPYDSFGRVLAVVTRDGKNLADELIAGGFGVPMTGR